MLLVPYTRYKYRQLLVHISENYFVQVDRLWYLAVFRLPGSFLISPPFFLTVLLALLAAVVSVRAGRFSSCSMHPLFSMLFYEYIINNSSWRCFFYFVLFCSLIFCVFVSFRFISLRFVFFLVSFRFAPEKKWQDTGWKPLAFATVDLQRYFICNLFF